MKREKKEIIEDAKSLCELGLRTYDINRRRGEMFTPLEYYVHLLKMVGQLLNKAEDEQPNRQKAIRKRSKR